MLNDTGSIGLSSSSLSLKAPSLDKLYFISYSGSVCSVCRCSLQAIKPPPLPPRLFFNIHLQHLQLTAFSGLLDQFPSAAITPTLLLPLPISYPQWASQLKTHLLLYFFYAGILGKVVLRSYLSLAVMSTAPIPPAAYPWNIPGRIAELKAIINNPETSDEQKINVQVAINLYGGKMQPIPRVCIQGGKVINLQKLDFSRPFWMEGYLQQLSAQTAIPATEPAS
ncbi:hypothetical protein HL42_0115 [Trichophyton rubrum]|nr:hypothetical protein HL42_0115 [Trichophyton rubrum]